MVNKFLYLMIIIIFLLATGRSEIYVLAEMNKNYVVVTSARIKENLTLEINFTHSVQKTPVIEELNFDGEKFILLRTKYKSHGVGLPFMESDGVFREEDGYFIMDDMNRPIKNLSLRTGVGTNLTIKLDGEEIKLYEKYPEGTEIDIIKSSSLEIFFMMLKRRIFTD